MLSLISSLKEPIPAFDTVLHIGAGPDFQEELYAQLSSKKTILVDADPENAEELRMRAGDRPIQVVEALISAGSEKKPFYCYSLRSLNGVFPLGPIQDIYPRAKEMQRIDLKSQSFDAFLDSLGLDLAGKHALILGVPGLEADLLTAGGDRISQLFDWIFLTGAGSVRPDGAKPFADTHKTLEKLHFGVVSQDGQKDPLQHQALFKRDEKSLALAAAQKLISELSKKRDELAEQLDVRTKERDQTRSEKESLVKERDQLKKTAGDRAARIAELEAQVADQAERQKLIDEQMIRAETQLEMLKEFLKPAF